jgi:hypothetical protein
MALPLLRTADVVYCVIEGCIKADAVLSAGGAVFSVPSVSLWNADELPDFAEVYLADKEVVIICDADWHENALVVNQARLCQDQLRRLGVTDVHVAALSIESECKGVDDYLGAGGGLDDLVVIDNVVPPGLWDYAVAHRRSDRIDGIRRDYDVLRGLSSFTGESGELYAPRKTVAKVLGVGTRTVDRAITNLEQMGAVTVDGSRRTKIDYWSHKEEWWHRPMIILAPALRAVEKPPERLADVIAA